MHTVGLSMFLVLFFPATSQANLSPPPLMPQPVKIIDENMNWSNAGMEVNSAHFYWFQFLV